MKVYVYSKNSSKYNEKKNNKIIKKIKDIYNDLIVMEYDQLINYDINNIDYLIVSGGDGIIHNVVNYCKDKLDKIVFGFIPTGTANDFCHNHNIKSVKQAIEVIKNDSYNNISLIGVNEIVSLYAVSIGMMSNVSINAKKRSKKIFHKFIYILKGIRYFFCKKNEVIININKKDYHKYLKALIISNTKYLGGIKVFKALNNNLNIIKIKNIFDLIDIFLFNRFKNKNEDVLNEFKVYSDSKWCIDGEEYLIKEANIKVIKNKLRLLSKNT